MPQPGENTNTNLQAVNIVTQDLQRKWVAPDFKLMMTLTHDQGHQSL